MDGRKCENDMKIIQSLDTGYPSSEYAAKVKCLNCKEIFYIAIEKGITVRDYVMSEYCPNCVCKELSPYED